MQVKKIVSIAVVSLASLIVLAAIAFGVFVFASSRSANQQNFAPSDGQKMISSTGQGVIFSQSSGSSSFLCHRDAAKGAKVRLTSASQGIESEPNLSHSGKLIAFSFASSPTSKSTVYVVGADGNNAHALTGPDEDALHPVFSPDDSKIFYAASSFTGNHSPIARPARHDWDVFSVPIEASTKNVRTASTQITHASFYDMQSLDVVADSLSLGVVKILVSTTAYPIGALIQEFNLGPKGRDKIFQPHVRGESSIGPAFGEARFMNEGMDIVFLAATDTSNGTYDYNVYSMSDVTGGEIQQLTTLKGMTKELNVWPGKQVTFVNGGITYLLDVNTRAIKPL